MNLRGGGVLLVFLLLVPPAILATSESSQDCKRDGDCAGELVCGPDGFCRERCRWACHCSKGVPGFCREGEGDCDSDHECDGALVCGADNCAWGGGTDCCEKPRGTQAQAGRPAPLFHNGRGPAIYAVTQ